MPFLCRYNHNPVAYNLMLTDSRGWASKNANNVGSRSVSTAAYNSMFSTICDSKVELFLIDFSVCPIRQRHIDIHLSYRRYAALSQRKSKSYCNQYPSYHRIYSYQVILHYEK